MEHEGPSECFLAHVELYGEVTRLEVTGAGSILLTELDDGRHPWLDTARRRPDLDGLAPMLLAVALRRASDRADLSDVRRLLELAVRLGLADGRAFLQATGLLRRGTALSRYVETALPAAAGSVRLGRWTTSTTSAGCGRPSA